MKPLNPDTILVVDDEPAHLLFAQRVLSGHGWRVVTGTSGGVVLPLAVTENPVLVLVDLNMPEVDGVAATRRLRADGGRAASVPVLAYTARRDIEPGSFDALGLDGMVRKPCMPDVLLDAVDQWRPDGALDGLRHLESVLEPDEIGELLGGFRQQLTECLQSLSGGAVQDKAHRLAGVAGMLGFSDLCGAWLALSEGDLTDVAGARRLARLVLAAIDRDGRVIAV